MKIPLRKVIYGTACALALLYLAVANARGYVPFVTSTHHGSMGTANHFHK
jgi:hypothetical protein